MQEAPWWAPQCLTFVLIVFALGVEMGRIGKLQMCLRNMFGFYLGRLRDCRYFSSAVLCQDIFALTQASLIQPSIGTGLGATAFACEVFPWGRVVSKDR